MSRWRKNFITIFAVLCLAIIVSAIHHYQLRFALEHYIAERTSAGEPMELTQVIPVPSPPERNAVPFIIGSITNLEQRNLFATNTPQTMQAVALGHAMIGWQQPDIRSSNATNTWEDLARELAAVKSKLDTLRNLTNHPVLDFHLDYQQETNLRMLHIGALYQVVTLLNASVLNNLHQGRTAGACADIHTILRVVKGLTGEPTEHSQGSRIANAKTAGAATWELLQSTNISEKDLAALQRDWQTPEFLKPVERAYLMERVLVTHSSEYRRKHADELWQYVMTDGAIDKFFYQNRWRYFWSYDDEKRALQIYQILIEATRVAETNRSYQAAKTFATINFARLGIGEPQIRENMFRMDIDAHTMRWISSEDAHAVFGLLRRSLIAETTRNMVVAAIALKRYELKEHHLPATLRELMPDFLETVPIDWMDGQPLRYRLKEDGTFLLYSVGENGKDDGGSVLIEKKDKEWDIYWQNPNMLDWVWPQPATPDEVEKFRINQMEKLNSLRKKR